MSFAYDASLKQALAITPGMAMQYNLEEDEEDDTIDFIGTAKKGGIYGTTVGPTSVNVHQGKRNSNPSYSEIMMSYDAFIPKVSPTGPFSKVCFEVGSGVIWPWQHRCLPKSWKVYTEWE